MDKEITSVVGQSVPNPYGKGTWTVEKVDMFNGELLATILWKGTGSAVLDDKTTMGTLAPGSLLWEALHRAYHS